MVITKRNLIIAALVAAWDFQAKDLRAESLPDLQKLLLRQRANLKPSGVDQTTVGYQALARIPELRLPKLRRSVGFLERVLPGDKTQKLSNAKVREVRGSALYLGNGIVAVAAHEVDPKGFHKVSFYPHHSMPPVVVFPDFLPQNIDQTLDLAFGRLKGFVQIPDLEAFYPKGIPATIDPLYHRGVRPLQWSSWNSNSASNDLIVTLGFVKGLLHASVGSATDYENLIFVDKDLKALTCKAGLSNLTVAGQSGGLAAHHGRLVGQISTGSFARELPELNMGSYITPFKAIGAAFLEQFPTEARRAGLDVPAPALRSYQESFAACRTGNYSFN